LLQGLIAGCGLPLSLVDPPFFVETFQFIAAQHEIPSRYQLTNDLIPSMGIAVVEWALEFISKSKCSIILAVGLNVQRVQSCKQCDNLY